MSSPASSGPLSAVPGSAPETSQQRNANSSSLKLKRPQDPPVVPTTSNRLSLHPPFLEAPASLIQYQTLYSIHHVDQAVFDPGPAAALVEIKGDPDLTLVDSVYFQEWQTMQTLEDLIQNGQEILAVIYTYRSVARAVPQTSKTDAEFKKNLYSTAVDILRPEIQKAKVFHQYMENAIPSLVSCLRDIVTMHQAFEENQREGGFASLPCLLKIAQILALFLVMDSLKNAKASLNNDLSAYKRCISSLKSLTTDVVDDTQENFALYEFLSNSFVITNKLKKHLKERPDLDNLLVDICNAMCQLFESKLYLTPDSKHVLLKAMVFCLFLLDQEGDDRDITKIKRLKLDKCSKIIKSNPVVPLFGDMSMTLTTFFGKNTRLGQQKWKQEPKEEQLIASRYKIISDIADIRTKYQDYIFRLKTFTNTFPFRETQENIHVQVYNILFEGVNMLGDWSARVLEQSAWKFAHPAETAGQPDSTVKPSLYELAVRYNYSKEEQFALVEVLAMLKSLAGLLLNVDASVMQHLYHYMYTSIQKFARSTIKEMYVYQLKKKKPKVLFLEHLNAILLDERFDQQQRGEKQLGGVPSLSQQHFTRVLLEAMVSEKNKLMLGGFFKEKEYKDNQVAEVNDFLRDAFFFPFMMNFSDTVRDCSDLSELWYKEFYLELSKQIQFPIEMSLPWILTDVVLESNAPDQIENLLYPMDLYNDAANRALHHLKSRYLFEEIEAEVNLCFDQFLWKLSRRFYKYCKSVAACQLIDKSRVRDSSAYQVECQRLSSIIQQKNYQLLGRSINISKIAAQHCNQYLRQSVDAAISRFEASDLSSIVELESLLRCNRQTHRILSDYLMMDSFEEIMIEIDENASLVAYQGRIVTHVIQELVSDFLPNYRFSSSTQRFYRVITPSAEDVQRNPMPKSLPLHLYGTKSLNQAYQLLYHGQKSYVGGSHFESLLRVLSPGHLAVITGELANATNVLLKLSVTPYVQAISQGMHPSMKLPGVEYGFYACFEFFLRLLQPILTYRELRSGVFQVFRELGNTIVFLQQLETAKEATHLWPQIHGTKLFGFGPSEPKYDAVQILSDLETAHGDGNTGAPLRDQAQNSKLLYEAKEKCFLLDNYLNQLRPFIVETLGPRWEPNASRPEELGVDKCTEFYRMWSCALFAFCVPNQSSTEKSNLELFGDGFIWAGALFLLSLNEHKRFDALDINKFLLYVRTIDTKPLQSIGALNLNQFLENANHCENVYRQSLSVLLNLGRPPFVKWENNDEI